MKTLFRPEVPTELDEAALWYEQRRSGLGDEFLQAVEATRKSVEQNPQLYPVIHRNIRRALLKRFPYGIYYVIRKDMIAVLAIHHQSRDPARWKRRR